MECSPTKVVDDFTLNIPVAVPVNYRMPSYQKWKRSFSQRTCRSPHQIWNDLQLTYEEKWLVELQSQSPSILECASIRQYRVEDACDCVAVPINYGMFSYWIRRDPRITTMVAVPINSGMHFCSCNGPSELRTFCRSPRQLWKAILLWHAIHH